MPLTEYHFRPSMGLLLILLVVLLVIVINNSILPLSVQGLLLVSSSSSVDKLLTRRTCASELISNTCKLAAIFGVGALPISPSFAAEPSDSISSSSTTSTDTSTKSTFTSKAYGLQEYTNSIVASRDTNISPAEAYDVIRQQIPMAKRSNARAADIGAGAGLSTTILYAEKGYRSIAAVDWSRSAWDTYAGNQPQEDKDVIFYEMDDDSFFSSLTSDSGNEKTIFDVIVYNFAINKEKAVQRARKYLSSDGLLFAPCNDRKDYWYKQSYMVFDNTGSIVWTSGAYIDAWLIQFQPDVTSTECTGIWCGNFNGFFEKRREQQQQLL